MKKIISFLLGLILGLLPSCEIWNRSESYSFTGKVQKGPFIAGTNIAVNELNSNLDQTGKSFTTTIVSDDGSFSLDHIELKSSVALLTANGFYYSELYDELSGAMLSLQAVADLSGKETVNINVFTHLIKGRIETLVAEGSGFGEANRQARSELLTFLGVTDSGETDFVSLDISGSEEFSGALLAFSILLQRYTMIWNERPLITAELTQLLSKLSTDFAPDGQISDPALIDALMYNVSQLNLLDIRRNIENKYSDLGQSVTIPGFEKYIAKFQEKFSDNLYTSFYYPDSASPEPILSPDGTIPNLLVPADTGFRAGLAYSVAAIIPLNATLTIKFISDGSGYSYSFGGANHGWEIINEHPNGFTFHSQRQNELMTALFHLESPGTATIEYYENSPETPTFTKQIHWN